MTLLTKEHDRNSFCSGVAELDAFLRTYASQNAKKDLTRTYVAARPSSKAISGYYSIRMGEVVYDLLPETDRKGLPMYPLPVVHLARLAVDERERGKKLGEVLLLDAFERAMQLATVIGAAAIEVLAKNDPARSFYSKYGFSSLLDGERHMYISMRAVRQALA
ncbi:MAG TPA: GNAT family N-acetyltransferase [Kofleriaceae bacterium]|nr:GNAT family N-acetyltransferase [Kofleriaceae bacterium]